MKFDDINGRKIKSDAENLDSSDSVSQSYHNKHVDGSGNFGIVVKVQIPEGERPDSPLGGKKEYNWVAKITGRYDEEKNIGVLKAGTYSGVGSKIPADYDSLIEAVEKLVESQT